MGFFKVAGHGRRSSGHNENEKLPDEEDDDYMPRHKGGLVFRGRRRLQGHQTKISNDDHSDGDDENDTDVEAEVDNNKHKGKHKNKDKSGTCASKGYPTEIKQSIGQVETFLAARLSTKCHFCQSGVTGDFSVKDWMRRWSEGAKGRSSRGGLICAASCPNCDSLTCLGCGREPKESKKAREVDGYDLDWCCRDGRLFGIWVMLARCDQVEIRMQNSLDSGGGGGGGGFRGFSRHQTRESKGTGYASKRGAAGPNPFVPLFYDGPGAPPQALTKAIAFEASDTRTDEVLGMILQLVSEMIPGPTNKNLPLELRGMLQLSLLVDKVAELLRNDSLEDVARRDNVYSAAFRFVGKLGAHPELIGLVQAPRYHKQQTPGLEFLSSKKPKGKKGQVLVLGENIASVGERFKQLARQSEIVLSAAASEDLTSRGGKAMLDLCEEIAAIYETIASDGSHSEEAGGKSGKSKSTWEAYHQEHGLSQDETVFERGHAYFNSASCMSFSRPGRIKRLVTEVANMATSLPVGVFVKVSESRPDVMRCLIMGPPDSPYGYGLFDFDLFCGAQYPHQPPQVKCRTAVGRTLNPNLHSDGKVCLSLLGTWRDGDAAAQWQPGKSTILSVLISIQAMIFNEDPWRNEPGYTNAVGREAERSAQRYIQKTQPQTIEVGMLQWIQRSHQRHGIWKDVIRAHFKYNGAKMLANVGRWAQSNSSIQRYGLLQSLKAEVEDMAKSR